MSEMTRRTLLRGVGGGVIGIGSGAFANIAAAEIQSVELEVDSLLGTGDGSYDSKTIVDSSKGGNLEHGWFIEAIADLSSDDAGCKDEEITTELHQERKDCSSGDYYWETVGSVSERRNLEGESASSKNGTIPTDGTDWVATGSYRIVGIITQYANTGCDYDWDEESDSKSTTFSVTSDTTGCGGGHDGGGGDCKDVCLDSSDSDSSKDKEN